MWILWQKTPKNCTKSAISQFATFTQLQSPKKFHTLHFLIFSLEILNMASKLNLAVNYLLRFLNFDFGAKVEIQKSKQIVNCQIKLFKISSENIEKFRV